MKDKDIKTILKSVPILLAAVLYLVFSNQFDKKETNDNVEVTVDQTSEIAISTQYAEEATGKKLQEVKFLNVNDGDTFNVELDGKKQRVRLLMIDTPEMNYDKGEPMPYAEEAKAFTQKLMSEGKKIELLFDKGPETDNYDRLLAYVFVDGKMVQEHLLENGLGAIRYVNKPNNTLEQQLRAVQKKAEDKKINIWSLDGYFENNRFQNIK